jgi:soluble lytic murein transglycosylase-like protein
VRVARALLPLLVLGLSLVPGQPAYGDMYQYTDKDGVVHFTNIQPRGGNWKKVQTSEPDRGTKPAAQRGGCAACDRVPAADASPERYRRFDKFIYQAAELYRIPVPLIRAVIKQESDYDPRVVSSADAKGLMQLMPAAEIGMGLTGDVFDPRNNIFGGTRLLRWLANHLDGDLVLTIAAYHAGLGSVAKYGYTVPPYAQTRHYLKKVLEYYYSYKAEEQRARAK